MFFLKAFFVSLGTFSLVLLILIFSVCPAFCLTDSGQVYGSYKFDSSVLVPPSPGYPGYNLPVSGSIFADGVSYSFTKLHVDTQHVWVDLADSGSKLNLYAFDSSNPHWLFTSVILTCDRPITLNTSPPGVWFRDFFASAEWLSAPPSWPTVISSVLSFLLSSFSFVFSAIISGSLSPLLSVLGVSIGVSLIVFVFLLVKKSSWGA